MSKAHVTFTSDKHASFNFRILHFPVKAGLECAWLFIRALLLVGFAEFMIFLVLRQERIRNTHKRMGVPLTAFHCPCPFVVGFHFIQPNLHNFFNWIWVRLIHKVKPNVYNINFTHLRKKQADTEMLGFIPHPNRHVWNKKENQFTEFTFHCHFHVSIFIAHRIRY